MSEREEASDKVLRCALCGDGFVFSAGEQELFRLRGIRSEPVHCPNCARGRILARPRATAQRVARR
jgi:DNA-directed RNA polymerase subunit RPC12/RpoP